MKSLKVRILSLTCVLALAGGAVINGISLGLGGPELQLPPSTLLICLVLAALALWLGLQVKKYRDRQRRQDAPGMNPLLAARTAVFAQTCAYSGALLAGWHIALLFYQISMLSIRSLWGPVYIALIDVIAGLVLLLGGLFAEAMCKIPPSDSDEGDSDSQATVPGRQSRGYARGEDS